MMFETSFHQDSGIETRIQAINAWKPLAGKALSTSLKLAITCQACKHGVIICLWQISGLDAWKSLRLEIPHKIMNKLQNPAELCSLMRHQGLSLTGSGHGSAPVRNGRNQ
jgi:hypothetical protein